MPSMDATLPFVSPEKSTTGRLRPIPAPSWLRTGMRVASSLAPGAAARVEGLGHLRILRDERCVAAAVGFLAG